LMGEGKSSVITLNAPRDRKRDGKRNLKRLRGEVTVGLR